MSKASEKAAEKAAYKHRVQLAIERAYAAAEEAFLEFRSSAELTKDGYIRDACGFASLTIYKPSYKFRTELAAIGEISKNYRGGWVIGNFSRCVGDQSITAHEKANNAARMVLEEFFPEEPKMFVSSRLD